MASPEAAGCPQCGAPVDLTAGQLCPACLMEAALAVSDEAEETLAADDPLAALSGDNFGPYKPVRVLGVGGMGVVFLAEQSGALRRNVALKVLKTDLDTRAITRRFDRERQTLARLDHPNIVTIFDAGMSTLLRPYFVMEAVDGLPLHAYCDRRRLTVRERIAVFLQLCSAIEHAHQCAVVHRDLKPGNVLVVDSAEGGPRVKVIDFGIAKIAAAANAQSEASVFTRRGQFAGTPGYMSPEQAGAVEAPIGPASDVYALGAMLYELLCGRRIFDFSDNDTEASNPLSVLRKISEEDPLPMWRHADERAAGSRGTDAAGLSRQLRGDLEAITLKALARDPARRYASVAELSQDLTRFLELRPVQARRPGPLYRMGKWVRRNRPAAGVAVAAVSLAVAAGVYATRPRAEEPLALTSPIPLSTMEGTEQNPTFSPDGQRIAFNWDGPGQQNHDIYVSSGPGEPPRRLTTDPAEDVSPSWAPLGEEIAFVRALPKRMGMLMVVNAATGEEKVLTTLSSGHAWFTTSIDWSPDGRWLVVLERTNGSPQNGLTLYSRTTGERRVLTAPPLGTEHMQPAFSRDGRSILFVRDQGRSGEIMRLPLTPDLRPAGPEESLDWGSFPASLRNGDVIFESFQQIRHQLWRLPAGTRQRQLLAAAGDNVVQAVASRDGRRLVVSQRTLDTDIVRYRISPSGKATGPEPFAQTTLEEHDSRMSPDGTKVAFISERAGGRHLWMADAVTGANLKKLSEQPGPEEIRWQPDGQAIYFTSRLPKIERRFRVDLRTGEHTEHPGFLRYIAFSPDGKTAYIDRDASGKRGIFKLNASDTKGESLTVLMEGLIQDAALDPRGEWFYFTLPGSELKPLYRLRADGSSKAHEQVLPAVLAHYFLPTRAGLYFLQPQGAGSRLSTLMLARWTESGGPGKPAELTPVPMPLVRTTRFLTGPPDGSAVYFSVRVKDGADLTLFDLPPAAKP